MNNMRIWHEQLIPKLCQKHLVGVWKEGSQTYDIITCEKIIYKGKKYRKYCNTCGVENKLKIDRCQNKECKGYKHDKGKKLDGYFYHPAVKEFENHIDKLEWRLISIREEMLKRGYKPKELTLKGMTGNLTGYKEWQDLNTQIEVLRSKKCNCKV